MRKRRLEEEDEDRGDLLSDLEKDLRRVIQPEEEPDEDEEDVGTGHEDELRED